MAQFNDAYLSVIDWPDGLDPEARAHVLVKAAGLDLYTARLRVARGTPQVVARLPDARARGGLDVLHRAGATAFAPTRAELSAVAAPVRAKRIVPADGAPEPMFMVEAWRGDGLGMLARGLFPPIRARVEQATSRVSSGSATHGGIAVGGTAIAGRGAGIIAAGIEGASGGVDRTTSLHVVELIDLHLHDGTRVRIDGTKFSFDILGHERGHADRQNMDRLALRLAQAAPRAMVDTSFKGFVCPPEFARDSWTSTDASSVHTSDQAPAFEFYSRWVSLMYRSLLAG